MNIFLSHARKDGALARQLAQRLRDADFAVWIAEEEITPGDNWAKKMGQALDDTDLMVLLFTPGALDSDRVRQDVELAIGSRKFERRVFSVYVGPSQQLKKNIPWILLRLPHRHIESARSFGYVVKDIEALAAATEMSATNA